MDQRAPKRHRFSDDNPFCDSSDTDLSHDEGQQKEMACSPSNNPTNPIDTTTCPLESSTQQDVIPTDMDQAVGNKSFEDESSITFNVDFDDFNVQHTDRDKLIADFKKAMTQFKRGEMDEETEGVEEIKKTLQDLQPLQDVVYLYVRFAGGQQSPSNFLVFPSLCGKAMQCQTLHVFD